MNADENQLTAKRKSTARILSLVAALFIVVPCLGLHWLRAPEQVDLGMNLWQLEACDGSRCQSTSNFEIARMMRKAKQGEGAFAYAGIATLVVSVVGGLSLAAAGALAFKDRFIRQPIALTTVALLSLCLALVTACVFVGAKPQGLPLGVSWPFFLYAAGVVVGIAGAQMLAKAFSQVSDPYWDGLTPDEPGPPAPPPFEL